MERQHGARDVSRDTSPGGRVCWSQLCRWVCRRDTSRAPRARPAVGYAVNRVRLAALTVRWYCVGIQRRGERAFSMPQTTSVRSPVDVIPFLLECGYAGNNVLRDYRFGTDESVAVAAFAHEPHDARSVCIGIGTTGAAPARTVEALRPLAAPVLFLVGDNGLEWWKPGAARDERRGGCALADVASFFAQHKADLAPEALFRAKNFGAHQRAYQLDFVDAGLLPFAERAAGEKLSALIEDMCGSALRELGVPAGQEPDVQLFHWLFESVFHLLAGKILRDKDVPHFRSLDLVDAADVVGRVRNHYGRQARRSEDDAARLAVLAEMATRIAQLSSLCNLTTETLGFIYEQTLVTPKTRRELGTHSTPSYLIDYVVWSLVDWIEQIPETRRHVFEPCCGHAGFLIAAMRLLRDLRESENGAGNGREYLRQRLHGLEADPFALEIARLGLTLADVPNPNGWDLTCGDVFDSRWPGGGRPVADILFMNPPFERFSPEERRRYREGGLTQQGKAEEVLARALPAIRPDGVFGIVLPQGFLHSRDGQGLRQRLCGEFELREVTLLPDKVFNLSGAESAILLGRRRPAAGATVRIGRVDDWGIESFREHQALSDIQVCTQGRLAEQPGCALRIPRLDAVWREFERLPRLGSLVEGGQGLQHVGKDKLPRGTCTVSDHPFLEAVRGFTTLGRETMVHGLPAERWVSVASEAICPPRWGTATGLPQVLLNYARASRGPWRLKAFLDPVGHAVTSRFVVLRPRQEGTPLELVWALVNSPVANAYAFCHLTKRDNTVGVLLKLPVPRVRRDDADRVVAAVQSYINAAQCDPEHPTLQASPDALRDMLLHVDAEVLRLYNLPPRLERLLLDLFQGHERQGVPFRSTEYFPPDFRPCIPLGLYLSDTYRRGTAAEIGKCLPTFDDPEINAALRAATEAFTLSEDE